MYPLKEAVTNEIKPEILNAFNMMWGNFPFLVVLLRKNRTILALNKKARELGVKEGMKCYQLSRGKGIHKECMADAALKEDISKRSVLYSPALKQVLDSYWIPVEGVNDLYVHFATDISDYAKAEMFPATE
jgi:hypothetical protein